MIVIYDRYFQQRLLSRPFELNAISALIEITYEQQDNQAAVIVIQKSIHLGVHDSSLFIKLGKCYFRRWLQDGTAKDLENGMSAYRHALEDAEILRGTTPVPHFEMITMLLRLGRVQEAFDMFTIVNTVFSKDTSWLTISQYNIAQSMLIIGNLQVSLPAEDQSRSILCGTN